MAAKASAKSSRKEPVAAPVSAKSKRKLAAIAPIEPPVKQLSLEERVQLLEQRLMKADPEFQRAYRENLDMSWIYHDSALEGTVYTSQELKCAIDPSASIVTDSSIQPICEEIRRHREALDFIRDYAVKKRQPINVDVVKKIYLILHPEEGDIKTVKYRKDIPQHRLYFHEYAPPDKITYKVRQIIDWTNDPETRRTRSAIRIAARAHYDLLRVFPFTTDSGKVARLFMNLLLLRSGYPPSIVHSTERQRYYEALKGSSATMTQIVHESIENNLASVEKLLDAHESKGYAVRV
jgi:Fic family protein